MRYTFFIAHAGGDAGHARQLRDKLHPDVVTFLAGDDLKPGERWDVALPRAQEDSRATVVLVSAAIGHYREEEISRAIDYWRASDGGHRLIPVYLDGFPSQPLQVPYGLRNVVGLDAAKLGLDGVAAELRQIAVQLQTGLPPRGRAPGLSAWLDSRRQTFGLIRVPGPVKDLQFEAHELVVPLELQLHRRGMREPESERLVHGTHSDGVTGDFRDAFAVVEERNLCVGLAIIGDPGSGKTTLLRQIFCEAHDAGSQAVGLPAGLTPVFVGCRMFERVQRDLWTFESIVEAQAAADGHTGASAALFDDERPLLLLLDGLDEVNDEATRTGLCEWLEAEALTRRGRWRFVVTSRVATWQRESRLADDHFLTADVLALDEPTIRRYVHLWFRAEGRRERLDELADKCDRDADLQAAALLDELFSVDGRRDPNLVDLMRNPLSLALLCQVHTRHEKLPTRRGTLYEVCLNVFLERRPKQQHRPYLPASSARAALQPLAWLLQNRAIDDLPRKEIEYHVARVLTQHPDLAEFTPEAFVSRAWLECGVLRSRDIGRLGFFHAALREYLAASYAVEKRMFRKLAKQAGDPRWRSVLLLAMSLRHGFSGLARAFLECSHFAAQAELLSEGLRQAASIEPAPFVRALAGAAATASARTHTTPEDVIAILWLFKDRGEQRMIWRAATRLRDHPDERVRRAVAQALVLAVPARGGAESLGPVPGAKRGQLWRETITGLTFVWIPAGEFWMGSSKERGRNYDPAASDGEVAARRVKLTRGFWMAQHPVTNEIYGRFLAAADYAEPQFWRNARFNKPDQPVVGVSFHDAVAFCQWATKAGDLQIDLPTEAEWEYAARAAGGDGGVRRYPWGHDDPTPERAVFHPASGPAAVGGRPAGATTLGIHDMAGNVWEWCLDVWGAYPRQALDDVDVDPLRSPPSQGAAPRVVRGGSWIHGVWGLRAALRFRNDSGDRSDGLGFRVVCRALR